MKVIYTGTEPIEHRTGTWIPGESKELPEMAARALVKERGDMEILYEIIDERETETLGPAALPEERKPKAKARKKGGGE